MSKIWTKQEEAILFQAMAGKKVMYAPKAKEIAKALPGRTAEAIRRHWLLIRYNEPLDIMSGLQYQLQIERARALQKRQISPPQYNPVDVAFTRPITKTDIIRHYRDMGLRGKVTIELGD